MIASEWNALQSPNNKVLGYNGVLNRDDEIGLPSPSAIGDMAAWYDATDFGSMVMDASGNVSLLSDVSEQSTENCLVLPGVSGNYASFPALTAFGTGDFSISQKVYITSLAAIQKTISGDNNSFAITVQITSGTLITGKAGVANNAASTGAVVPFTECVIGYTRSGTTGIYYINGVAAGTITDSQDYTAGVSALGIYFPGGTQQPMFGNMYWTRVYNAALDATAMAADAAGTVQANNIFDADFTNRGASNQSFPESSSNAALPGAKVIIVLR